VGFKHLEAQHKAWILSSWQIVLRRRPKIGEAITVATWATGFEGIYGIRNFEMKDEQGQTAACANSIWVYMDMQAGRPAKPSEEHVRLYDIEPALDIEYAPRKIKLPNQCQDGPVFPVRKYHIDTNGHVNNCQYVQMALEALPAEAKVRQVRVEYKKAAVFGDEILPKLAVEEDRTVVELCETGGKPFAIVEFIME